MTAVVNRSHGALPDKIWWCFVICDTEWKFWRTTGWTCHVIL